MQVCLEGKPKEKLRRIINKPWTGTDTEDQKSRREDDQPIEITIRATETGEENESSYDLLTFTPAELETIYNIVKEKFQENITEDMYSLYCFNM